MITKSNPAPLVAVTYLTSVFSPDYKAGEKGATRQIERHWAEQLVADGYAQFTPAESEEHHADVGPGDGPAIEGSEEQA